MRDALPRCLWLVLLLCGCGGGPDAYRPPIQRRPMVGPEAHLGQAITMTDPTADAYIARDISRTTEGTWRWAYKHPALRFYLRDINGLKFALDASVAGNTFKETGPVTLTILINDHALDKLRFEHPGIQHFEKTVPAAFLIAGAENLVAMEPDKVWVSKEDGATLSFLLIKAGFVK